MQKQEISNIMIFFVTQDLEGQPRQLEMHLMPEKEVSMMNQRFTEYLQRQREMYKPSLVQSHLPDLYLCRYQFPAGVSYPDIRLFDKDTKIHHPERRKHAGQCLIARTGIPAFSR